jgi:broad specificity phosphatase PhoE
MVLKHTDEWTKGRTIVYFVRHGDYQPDEGPKHPGAGLSAEGRRQAREVAKKFFRIRGEIDALYCSSMTRAIETADEISKKIGKKPAIYDELSEVHNIIRTGKFYHPHYWAQIFRLKKAVKALDRILEKNRKNVIIIVAHGNIMRSLLARKLAVPLRKLHIFDQTNCHISKARFLGKKLDYICYINSRDVL